MKLNYIAIIRSVGERTASLCEYSLIQNGIDKENIYYVKDISPFSEALKKSYEIAIESKADIAIIVDADRIILPNIISVIDTIIPLYQHKWFFVNLLNYDFISGLLRPGGPGIYNVKYLEEAIKIIDSEDITIRPETNVTKKMDSLGYTIHYLDIPSALHDYEQYRRNLFQKAMNVYWKLSSKREEILEKAKELSKNNLDWYVIHLAFSYAQNVNETIQLDYKQYDEIFEQYNIEEKEEIVNIEDIYTKLVSDIEYKGQLNFTQMMISKKTTLCDRLLSKISKLKKVIQR